MPYLLDTNVISEATRHTPDVHVLRWLGALHSRDFAISVVTLGELERGLLKLGPTHRAATLRAQIERTLGGTATVLDVDQSIMLIWARLTVEAEAIGRPAATLDALLAATCLRHGLTLATRNTRHFEAFAVLLFNPWTGEAG